MDTKNVIAAISLSAAVIILYSLFFAPSPNELKKIDEEKSSLNSEAPKLDSTEKIIELSRDQALKESNRVEFENQNIKGSISLLGGTIDDLFFKPAAEIYNSGTPEFFQLGISNIFGNLGDASSAANNILQLKICRI